MVLPLYNSANEEIGTIDIPDGLFQIPWKPSVVHQVVTAMEANKRRPWADTKGRGDVRGGGKRPWRQKGTGRARHSSIRSPLWKGGGVTFGPQKERVYTEKINKKMKRLALLSVLSKKIAEREIKIVDAFALESPKTKYAAETLARLSEVRKNQKSHPRTLMIPRGAEKMLVRAARNIEKNQVLHPRSLNVRDCLKAQYVFFEKKAMEEFIEHNR